MDQSTFDGPRGIAIERYGEAMFAAIEKINARPAPFELYTARELWTDEHTSARMLEYHLNEDVGMSSRVPEFIDRSVDWIVSRFNVGAGTRLVDFGCGPGLYTSRLARRQADVTGIDFSERSIRYARDVASRDGLEINYVHQDYLEYETDSRFHLVLMIMCDFCALSPKQRKKMLDTFHAILEPGGSLLLDVYSLAAFGLREEVAKYEANLLDGFWAPEKYYGFLNTFRYQPEMVVLDKYTIVERARVRTIYNWLQYFSPETLEHELSRCGFAVDSFYSDVAGSPFDPESGELAVVAKKL